MRRLTSLSEQQSLLQEQAQMLRSAYASFPRLDLEPYQPLTIKTEKGYANRALRRVPPDFDWRKHLAVPPAKFQGICNSCTSFATSAAIEIATMIENGGEAMDIAAQHMHTCVAHRGEEDIESICSYGIEPQRLLRLLVEFGYAVSQSEEVPFHPAFCPTVDMYATLQGFSEVSLRDVYLQIMKGPIVTDMYVWDDFFDYTTERAPIYSPNMTLGPSRIHSVCVVGFVPNGWIVKNSFGVNWGDGTGFGVIEKGTCGLLSTSPLRGEEMRPAYSVKV